MDFFEHQKWARNRTLWLMPAFFIALILVVLFFHIAVMSFVMFAEYHDLGGRGSEAEIKPKIVYEGSVIAGYYAHHYAPNVFLGSLIGVIAVVGGSSLYRFIELGKYGGERVAELLGGREISPFTQRFEERQLMNVVEEMSIASGIMVPGVYILDKEYRVNAFSAGFHRDFSVIGLSAGAMNYLDRDELQAMIAHEFSHIYNGDTRLNSLMIGILFGLNMITQIGLAVATGCIKFKNEYGEDEIGFIGLSYEVVFRLPVGLVMILIGGFGTLLASIIKSAISRQREYLADASAVQYTRNPGGLKGVLMKIGCPKVGSLIYSAHALETSHIFFAGVFGNDSSFGFLASHPNLTSRIRRLEPGFSGEYPKKIKKLRLLGKDSYDAINPPSLGILEEIAKAARSGSTNHPRHGRFIARARAAVVDGKYDPAALMASRRVDSVSGEVSEAAVVPESEIAAFPSTLIDSTRPKSARDEPPKTRSAITGLSIEELLELDEYSQASGGENEAGPESNPIPKSILNALETTSGAGEVFLAVLLDSDPGICESVFESLSERLSAKERKSIREFLKTLVSLRNAGKKTTRLPRKYIELRNFLLVQGISKLRAFSPAQYREFRSRTILIESLHGKLDLFRYAFYATLRNELDIRFGLVEFEALPVKYHSHNAVSEAIRLSLSYLAYAGHGDFDEAMYAFDLASRGFEFGEGAFPPEKCTFRSLDASLKRIRYASVPIRRKCLEAFRICICADGKITPKEDEIHLAAKAMIPDS